MAATIVILDRHRSAEDRLAVMIRREMIRDCRRAELRGPVVPRDRVLHAQVPASPAESWDDVARQADFLLGQLAVGTDRSGADIQTLLRRVLQDMVRLVRKGARQPCD